MPLLNTDRAEHGGGVNGQENEPLAFGPFFIIYFLIFKEYFVFVFFLTLPSDNPRYQDFDKGKKKKTVLLL